ncbi:MAG: YegS/Rv2252/BmrU family lipid kinase, partial [Clostridia bacterium]
MSLRHVFIINPKAGKHDSTRPLTEKITRVLSELSYKIEVTNGIGHATEIAKNLCRQTNDEIRIYACGGDGTLNEVVNGIYLSGCPKNISIGTIPTGSGNDFIKSFDIPKETFLDILKMTTAETETIDLLSVNGRASINIISVGYDAAVCEKMNLYKRIPLVSGSAAYKLAVVKCLITQTKHKFDLYADGKPVGEKNQNYLFAIAANGKYYGGGFKAAPTADMQDGLIDFVRIITVSRFKFASLVSG